MKNSVKLFYVVLACDLMFAFFYLVGNLNFMLPVISGITLLVSSKKIIKNVRRYDIDLLFLMSAAITFLFSVYSYMINQRSYFEVCMILITTYFVSKLIEEKTRKKTEKVFSDVFKMLPKKAIIVKNKKEEIVNTKDLKIGDIIVLNSGKKAPVDGKIIGGNCLVDESMITGESNDVSKNVGDEIIAGTILTNGSVKVLVEKIGTGTYLNQIVKLVKNAQKSKTKTRKKTERTYKKMMLMILTASVFSFTVWNFFFGKSSYISLRNAVSILVVSSNASLVLATPLSILFGITNVSKNGIIFKSGQIIEDLEAIDTYIFDKTGTLTIGRPKIIKIKSFGKFNENDIIRLAAIAEKRSTSRIAKIILEEAKFRKLRIGSPSYFKEDHGSGVFAKTKTGRIHVGNKKFMEKNGIKTDKTYNNDDILVAVNKEIKGSISIKDQVRRESKELVDFLKKRGNKVIMLTGDRKDVAKRISKKLGITKFYSGLTPKKKLEIVKEYQKKSKIVMIGDGINDAPSLSIADVGISIDTDNDLASESADVVLIRDDISLIKHLIIMSEETKRKIKQNFFWAYFYNTIAILIVGGGLFFMTGKWVDPFIASAASISSTLSVILNSLSLRGGFNDNS